MLLVDGLEENGDFEDDTFLVARRVRPVGLNGKLELD